MRPEILAPAGSMDSLKAAIAAGCDAIYIGGSRFGARAYADNPEQGDMVRAIEYCHLHGVKLYMTVNTLLKDDEIRWELYDYILPYYEAGLDAVIVQDMGVLRALHRWFPDLDLHASTQMNLTMGKGVDRLMKYGVTRIVPARELSLQELQRMRQDTDAELEVFVHGALCYCYSGRCLFSSMQGGRSGNRGRCAQPCRMQYHGRGRQGYYLSPKELCNLPHVAALMEIGVDSFKIEGRMKKPEYTAFVTAMYRKYVDLCFALGGDGFREWQQSHVAEWQDDLRKLAELYNREGFTSGYLEEKAGIYHGNMPKPAEMLSSKRPRHGGVKVGEVISVDAHCATYRLERDLKAQDVVEFRDRAGRSSYEYTVGEGRKAGQAVKARYQRGCHIKEGDSVYRTRHQQLLDEIYRDYLADEKSLPVCGKFTAKVGQVCTLFLQRQDITLTVAGELVQAAANQPATEEAVKKAMMQTGDSLFYFEALQIDLTGEVFLPVGMLKKLRRTALQQLEQALLEPTRRAIPAISSGEPRSSLAGTAGALGEPSSVQEMFLSRQRSIQELSVSVMTKEQLQSIWDFPNLSEIILRMDRMSDVEVIQAASLIRETGKRLLLAMPAIWRQPVWQHYEEEFQRGEGVFAQVIPDGYLISNMESFDFLQKVVGVSAARIRTEANLYVMNHEAASWWQEQGVREMTAPWELTGREWEQLEYKECLQIIIYGHIPLMTSAQCMACNTGHCAAKKQERNHTLRFHDDKKREFIAVNYCKYCYNIIYQGRPFSIQKQRNSWERTGYFSLRYDFTVEDGECVRRILAGQIPDQTELGHYLQKIQ